ncbi:type IV pilus modification PilV family protein [Bacillus cihuensis]|uniref:type IV pilus modification PilV family protein n=1 Tax=Bacillus cihuensis TaxID=1208599 RepID=UPI0003FEA24A|nr:type II secretion system protein [Bacillus cihuensis]
MNTLKNNQAFTLIEVLSSITILGIVLTIFLSFFSNAMTFSTKTEDKLTAINLAEQELYEVTNSLETYCKTNDCRTIPVDKYIRPSIPLNQKNYLSTVTPLSQSRQESSLGLLPISIRIESEDHKELTIAYGYVDVSLNN